MSMPEITQRDLRSRSREIMDEKLIRGVPGTRPALPQEKDADRRE